MERLYEINDFAGIKDTQIPYYIGYNFYPDYNPNNGYYVLRYNYYLKYGLFFPGQQEGEYNSFSQSTENDNYIQEVTNNNAKIYDSNFIIIGKGNYGKL